MKRSEVENTLTEMLQAEFHQMVEQVFKQKPKIKREDVFAVFMYRKLAKLEIEVKQLKEKLGLNT